MHHIDSLALDWGNSSVLEMELLQSCTKWFIECSHYWLIKWLNVKAAFLLGLCDYKSQRHEVWKICCELYQNILNWDFTHVIFQVPPLIFEVFSCRRHGRQKPCKRDVTPLLTYWNYVSFASSKRYIVIKVTLYNPYGGAMECFSWVFWRKIIVL